MGGCFGAYIALKMQESWGPQEVKSMTIGGYRVGEEEKFLLCTPFSGERVLVRCAKKGCRVMSREA